MVGKNSSQQVHKSTTTDRGNKEQSLAHSYLDKVQHVYVQVVIGSRNAEKEKGEQMYREKKNSIKATHNLFFGLLKVPHIASSRA